MKFSWKQLEQEQVQKQSRDYSKLSREQLLDAFQSAKWSKMEESEKVHLLQEMENRTALIQGRPPARVEASGNFGSYGSYNNIHNQMRIDVSNSSYEVLDTYIHESSHAYQHACIQSGNGYDQHLLNMMQAETARDDHMQLYNYARQSPYYDMQCNEMDSNNKALKFLIGEKARYENDADYKTYIAERFCHFQDVNTALTLQEEHRNDMQRKQADKAFARGDITKTQYDSLLKDLQNPEFVDSTVKESFALETQVAEIHHEFLQETANVSAESKECETEKGVSM